MPAYDEFTEINEDCFSDLNPMCTKSETEEIVEFTVSNYAAGTYLAALKQLEKGWIYSTLCNRYPLRAPSHTY